jgi:hypothetical protein
MRTQITREPSLNHTAPVSLVLVCAQPGADAEPVVVPSAVADAAVIADPTLAAPSDVAWDCNNCPATVAPVCAEITGVGIKVTVAHGCIASCQGMENVLDGSCEDLASAPGSGKSGRFRGVLQVLQGACALCTLQ